MVVWVIVCVMLCGAVVCVVVCEGVYDAVDGGVSTAVHISSIIKVNAQEKFLCRKPIWGPNIMFYVVDKLLDWPFLRKMIFIKFEQWGMG